MEYKVKIARKDKFEGRFIAKAISSNPREVMRIELSDYLREIKTRGVFKDCQVYIDGEDVGHYKFVVLVNAVDPYEGKFKTLCRKMQRRL